MKSFFWLHMDVVQSDCIFFSHLSMELLDSFSSIKLCSFSDNGKVAKRLYERSRAVKLDGIPRGIMFILFWDRFKAFKLCNCANRTSTLSVVRNWCRNVASLSVVIADKVDTLKQTRDAPRSLLRFEWQLASYICLIAVEHRFQSRFAAVIIWSRKMKRP